MKKLSNILLYIKVYSGRIWDSFWYAQLITIFKKINNNKIFKINIRFPEYWFDNKKFCNIFEIPCKHGLLFPTEIFLSEFETGYYFSIRIFGFGLEIEKREKITK